MLKKKKIFIIFNFLGFDIVWAMCAYGASQEIPLLGAYSAFIFCILHLIFGEHAKRDSILIAGGIFQGLIIDGLLRHNGILSFNILNDSLSIIPLWLIGLWASFILTIPYSLNWFRKNNYLLILTGMLAGPLAYLAGNKVGALNLAEPIWKSLLLLSFIWAAVFLLNDKLIRQIELRIRSEAEPITPQQAP